MYLINIAVMLLAANIGRIISKKFKQPAVLGQILMGIILGMGIVASTELVSHLAEIGVIFLMFIAGLETDINELKKSGKSSFLIAFGGVIFPFILVGGMTYLLTKNFSASLFMAITSTATSVSISVQTLREIGKLRTKQGVSILGAAIIDDIVGILLLTIAIGVVSPESNINILFVLGKIISFGIILFVAGLLIKKLLEVIEVKINLENTIVTYAVIVCFVLAFLSEEFGVAAIIGAYFSGVVFSMTSFRHRLSYDINKIATTMFTPLFFVSIGMNVDLRSAASALGVGSILILFAIIGKIVGSGLGAKLSGFNKDESLQIGIGMVPRAEVAIIIANLGLKLNVISDKGLATTILMVLVTTIVTPSLLKWAFSRAE
ncbi:MAG: cation:proton antiporter [Clostridiales bacterium]|nr:cation:proton antiporter [Clostridiales bacterium]